MLSPAVKRPTRLRGVGEWRWAEIVLQTAIRRDVWAPLAYFAIGFAPITSLALALFGVAPLHVSTLVFVLPATCGAVLLGVRYPVYGRLALRGFAVGIVAVLVYDSTRVPGIISGSWPDFIPNIGALLLQREEGHTLLGYAWRWLGNGAGMGMAFFMAYPLVSRRLPVWPAGLFFGVVVWACLMGTLVFAPGAQAQLFWLTPFTATFSLFGHLVFGGMLALVMATRGMNVRPYAPDLVGEGAPTAVAGPAVA